MAAMARPRPRPLQRFPAAQAGAASEVLRLGVPVEWAGGWESRVVCALGG